VKSFLPLSSPFGALALAVGLVLGAAAVGVAAAGLVQPAVRIQVDKITLLDLVNVGRTLIGVGERGVVARSDDGGLTWKSQLSPSSRTLTALAFANDTVGVAVGHGGSILRTEDAGLSWTAVTVKDIGRDAVLGVTALKSGRFVAFGAFGMVLVSDDQGRTWRRESVIADDFDRHISRVIEAHEALFLVGETGVMARSLDGGANWVRLKTPYEGSYFGILEMKDGALLAFGMRGNVFRSTDQGASWQKVPLATKATLNGGSVAADGRVVLAGNRGTLAISADAGRSFALMTVPEGTSIGQARWLADGSLVYAGSMATGRLSPERVAKVGGAAASAAQPAAGAAAAGASQASLPPVLPALASK
jgi:photosystem II stability/assembly factor-like uncharacterized protein